MAPRHFGRKKVSLLVFGVFLIVRTPPKNQWRNVSTCEITSDHAAKGHPFLYPHSLLSRKSLARINFCKLLKIVTYTVSNFLQHTNAWWIRELQVGATARLIEPIADCHVHQWPCYITPNLKVIQNGFLLWIIKA